MASRRPSMVRKPRSCRLWSDRPAGDRQSPHLHLTKAYAHEGKSTTMSIVSILAQLSFLVPPARICCCRTAMGCAAAPAVPFGAVRSRQSWCFWPSWRSMSPPGPVSAHRVSFTSSALAALIGALLTVTSRNPIYSALWFASVVLSTSGLFLLASAPFLAAGTIIVYAGAIIVTFLFVIMLAQMEGKALYDRAAQAPGTRLLPVSCSSGALIYSLSWSALSTDPSARVQGRPP